LILVVLHGTDMPFFDSRLNIAGWVLLAGLRSRIRDHHRQKQTLTLTPG